MRNLLAALTLGTALCMSQLNAAPASAAGQVGKDVFDAEQEKAIGAVVRQYLLNNPEILLEAYAVLEERQRQAQEDRRAQAEVYIKENQDAIFNNETAFVAGNPNGDVTIVEFFDYNCGYCKQAFGGMLNVVNTDKNIKLVFIELPLLGPVSEMASRAAIASKSQGKYMEYHSAMMQAKGRLNDERVFDIAQDVGLNIKKLKSDMASANITQTIDANHELARTLGIDGTPGFIIGTTLIPGLLPEEGFRALVAEARQEIEPQIQ